MHEAWPTLFRIRQMALTVWGLGLLDFNQPMLPLESLRSA